MVFRTKLYYIEMKKFSEVSRGGRTIKNKNNTYQIAAYER